MGTDNALYMFCFCRTQNVEPTNKRTLVAVDVSSSMSYGTVNGSSQITPVLGASVMAMATARSEPDYQTLAFSSGLTPVKLTAQMQLNDVFKVMAEVSETMQAVRRDVCY